MSWHWDFESQRMEELENEKKMAYYLKVVTDVGKLADCTEDEIIEMNGMYNDSRNLYVPEKLHFKSSLLMEMSDVEPGTLTFETLYSYTKDVKTLEYMDVIRLRNACWTLTQMIVTRKLHLINTENYISYDLDLITRSLLIDSNLCDAFHLSDFLCVDLVSLDAFIFDCVEIPGDYIDCRYMPGFIRERAAGLLIANRKIKQDSIDAAYDGINPGPILE
jgi:hypothetical protein